MTLTLIKTVLAWLVFWFVGMNLTGNVIAGLFPPRMPELSNDLHPAAQKPLHGEYRKMRLSRLLWLTGNLVLLGGFLWCVQWIWGGLMLVAAIMLMLVRAPEQVTETLTGARASNRANALDFVTMPLRFGALPVIWWALR